MQNDGRTLADTRGFFDAGWRTQPQDGPAGHPGEVSDLTPWPLPVASGCLALNSKFDSHQRRVIDGTWKLRKNKEKMIWNKPLLSRRVSKKPTRIAGCGSRHCAFRALMAVAGKPASPPARLPGCKTARLQDCKWEQPG